jgi:hypothetical protein
MANAATLTAKGAVNATPALLIRARAQGERDVYSGKRQWMRYNLGMRVTVSTDPTRASAAWDVSLHNISGGGVGFWSKRSSVQGTVIHIRDCSDSGEIQWLPARVAHCTIGLRGYLLGASFVDPAPPDDDLDATQAAVDAAEAAEEAATRPEPASASLRTTAARATATASASSVLITAAICWYFDGTVSLTVVIAMAFALALILGMGFGWAVARRQVRFLRSLQQAIRGMAVKSSPPTPLPDPPAAEYAAVHRALLGLAACSQKRKTGERIQRQRLEELAQMKSNILAIVSHDLRTPLSVSVCLDSSTICWKFSDSNPVPSIGTSASTTLPKRSRAAHACSNPWRKANR